MTKNITICGFAKIKFSQSAKKFFDVEILIDHNFEMKLDQLFW